MKRTQLVGIFAFVCIVGIIFVIGCGQQEQPADQQPVEEMAAPAEPTLMEAMVSEIEATGAGMQQYLKQENYQETWEMWPGKTALYEGTEPHGVLLTTYVNDTAHEALLDEQASLPDGSIIVKENYNPDKELMAVTVMYKVEGYNPDANDWFWLKYLADGTVEAEGKVDMCIACHGAKKESDYIWTELPQ